MSDDTTFDDDGEPVIPRGKRLAEEIMSRLSDAGLSAQRLDQHSFYGWGFDTDCGGVSYYNVLNALDGEAYLTVST